MEEKLNRPRLSSGSVISYLGKRIESGLSVNTTSFFMVAQLAGAGFLALPRAIADSGWLGIVNLVIFCISVAFSAIKLGHSWVILEERYPEYRTPARQPYVEIATKTFGKFGRNLSTVLLLVSNVGSAIVYLILMADMLHSLMGRFSLCSYVVILAVVLAPFTWFGTPKDFWAIPILAVIATVLAIVIIIFKILQDYLFNPFDPYFEPTHPNPTIASFSLGFGAIFFSFGGLSVFPTLQNDMKDRTDFGKSIIRAYAVVLGLYLPVVVLGYWFIGDAVDSNVILSVSSSPLVTVAIVFEIINLMGTLVIVFSPVAQCFEDMLDIPHKFTWKRVGIRSALMVFNVLVALAFPDFGLVVNFIGGFAMTILCFVLPPLMYLRLVDDRSNPRWPVIEIPLWRRIYLWEIVGVGIIGGIAATTTSLYSLLNPEQFASSCFYDFSQSGALEVGQMLY